jgi:NADH-quinone oxidoreductase subunit C
MAQRVLDRLKETFGAAILSTRAPSGDETAVVARGDLLRVVQFLREDPACEMDLFVDQTVVDYPNDEERFAVQLRLCSVRHKHRICVETRAPEEDPTVPSVTSVFGGALWFEREAWDLFGVRFEGHPDLRRILMYEEFEGHPLRKDYPAARAQPLVPYRDVPTTKPAPFGADEGMPWSRLAGGRRSRDTL